MHQSVESSPSSKMWRSQCSRRVIPIQSSSSTLDKLLPFKICIWDSDGDAGDITCDIVDSTDVLTRRLQINEDRKPGRAISKGHKHYDLTLSLQLGVRHSVGINSGSDVELRAADFDPGKGLWTRFPSEGSEITPPHRAAEFRWRDYCPEVFRHLRELFAVDPAIYVMSICGSGTLRELYSQGKSGSSFFVTQDRRFMIKTVKNSEVKVLIRILPGYYRHVHRYEKSLITRFFGVHCVKPVGGQKVHFIVMGNLFCSEHRIHRRFDLKGSSHGRSTDKAEIEFDETTTLKDLDLNFVFRLQSSWFREFFWQIERDCEFLEAEGIMDYSLLVGVHFNDDISASKIGFFSQETSCKWDSFKRGELKDLDRILENRKPAIRFGSNVPAKAECIKSDFGLSMPRQSGEICNVVLYFGIIDILQDYGINKKLEHAYKSLHADPTSISAVDPTHYSRRFRDFIRTVFIEDKDRLYHSSN